MTARFIAGYSLALLATLVSVFFFDRALAEWAEDHQLRGAFFEALTWGPDIFQAIVAIALLACLKKTWREKIGHISAQLFTTLILAWIVRLFTKYAFGRTWPDTWKNNNPSWLDNGIEGFFPFQSGVAYDSFPSGHAVVTFALATILWRWIPAYRWLWALLSGLLIIGMLGQYYHYLGDLLAGAMLGTLCGHTVLALEPRVKYFRKVA